MSIFHIRKNLSHLEAKMLEVSYDDIDAFILFVTSQVEPLAARGETLSDLLINVFTAFLAFPDKKFVEYIEKQKDKYDEGEDVSSKKLMQVALIKYKDRKRSDLWQAPSVEEEQILLLTAQIGELQKTKASAGYVTSTDKHKTKSSTKKGTDPRKKARNDRYNEKICLEVCPPSKWRAQNQGSQEEDIPLLSPP